MRACRNNQERRRKYRHAQNGLIRNRFPMRNGMGDFELGDFARSVDQISPRYAVATSPYSFCEPLNTAAHRGDCQVVEDFRRPPAITQRWNSYIRGALDIDSLHFEHAYRQVCALSDSNRKGGINNKQDDIGTVRIIHFDKSSGHIIIVGGNDGVLYIICPRIHQITMPDLWSGGPK